MAVHGFTTEGRALSLKLASVIDQAFYIVSTSSLVRRLAHKVCGEGIQYRNAYVMDLDGEWSFSPAVTTSLYRSLREFPRKKQEKRNAEIF